MTRRRRRPRRAIVVGLALATALAVAAIVRPFASSPDGDGTGPSEQTPSSSEQASEQPPVAAVRFSSGAEGCVTPHRDDWQGFMTSTGLGDLDGDGIDDRVWGYDDAASPVRGVIEASAAGGLAPVAADPTGSGPASTPRPGPVVTVAGRALVMLDLGGNTARYVGFAQLDGCRLTRLTVDGTEDRFLDGATGGACVPDCGAGVTCVPGGIETVVWETYAVDGSGQRLAWADVADDPDLRAADLRVSVTHQRFTLTSTGFASSQPSTFVTVVTDGRLPSLRDGFVCGPIELSAFGGEIAGFGIAPEVFDAEREALAG